jgi:Domain of unknown function DUF29
MQDLDRLYLDDFDAWCEAQIAALERHAGRLPPDIDAPHIAEELQIMLGRERHAAEAQVTRVIEHLLKLQFATEHEPKGRVWWRAVHGARSALHTFATPSLRPKLAADLPELYEQARELAKCALYDIGQITLGESLPDACPYMFEQILDEDWWPSWADER